MKGNGDPDALPACFAPRSQLPLSPKSIYFICLKEKELMRYSSFSVDDNFKEKETKKNWPDGISLNEMHTHICIYSSVLDLDKRSNAHVFSLSSLILEQTSISRMRNKNTKKKTRSFFSCLCKLETKPKFRYQLILQAGSAHTKRATDSRN